MSSMKTNFPNSIVFLIIHLIYPLMSEVINCDNDWSASHCYHTTIACNETSTTCSINCNGVGSCDGATINCNNNMDGQCNITCLGKNSCLGTTKESTIYCPSHANCVIFCDGDYSCDTIEIYCPQTSNCIIHANGQYALVNSYIHCPNTGQCVINCNNLFSCYDGRFDGSNTSLLTINCANNRDACKNMQVGCPTALNHNKRCQINGDSGTIHNEMRLYAINSWDDIDLTRFVAKTGNGEIGYQAMMSCDAGYDEQCIISLSSWNCEGNTSVCYREGIYPFPTPIPTQPPTEDNGDGSDDDIADWAAIIGIIVGCVLFLLFLCLGYFWCVKQQQTEKRKYETLDQVADPDADIMQKQTQHMYKSDVARTKNSKSFDIATKSGLHIVNEYSDASKFGGLLPISEEKTNETITSSNIEEEKENEKDALIATTNKNENITQNKTRDSNVIKQ